MAKRAFAGQSGEKIPIPVLTRPSNHPPRNPVGGESLKKLLYSAANAGRLIDRVDLLPELSSIGEALEKLSCRQPSGGSSSVASCSSFGIPTKMTSWDFFRLEPGRPTNRSHLLNHGVLIRRDRCPMAARSDASLSAKSLLQIKKRRVTRRHVRRRCGRYDSPHPAYLADLSAPIGAIKQKLLVP